MVVVRVVVVRIEAVAERAWAAAVRVETAAAMSVATRVVVAVVALSMGGTVAGVSGRSLLQHAVF